MSGYGISLFLHLVGLLSFFGAALMMHAIGSRLRRAPTVEEVRLWLGFARSVQPLFPFGGVLLLLTGAHLAGAGWDFRQPWILTALAFLLVFVPLGPIVQKPRFMSMGMAAGQASPGLVPDELARAITNPAPWQYLSMSTGAAVGLVWIMTIKPGWVGSLLPVLALAAIGWMYGGAVARRDRADQEAGVQAVASV